MKNPRLNPNDLVVSSFEIATPEVRFGVTTNDPTAQTFCRICPEETQTCYFCPEQEPIR